MDEKMPERIARTFLSLKTRWGGMSESLRWLALFGLYVLFTLTRNLSEWSLADTTTMRYFLFLSWFFFYLGVANWFFFVLRLFGGVPLATLKYLYLAGALMLSPVIISFALDRPMELKYVSYGKSLDALIDIATFMFLHESNVVLGLELLFLFIGCFGIIYFFTKGPFRSLAGALTGYLGMMFSIASLIIAPENFAGIVSTIPLFYVHSSLTIWPFMALYIFSLTALFGMLFVWKEGAALIPFPRQRAIFCAPIALFVFLVIAAILGAPAFCGDLALLIMPVTTVIYGATAFFLLKNNPVRSIVALYVAGALAILIPFFWPS
ncbi:MAG TPA: hypothetical protein PLV42_00150 [bacterium]|nr:hypothetical protein [bacterium]